MSASASSVASDSTTKVLYILGNQRGGTTIAGRLIGELPGFAFVGELRKLWEVALPEGRRCGCGKNYSQCPVWSRVMPVLADFGASAAQGWQRQVVPVTHSWWHAWHLSRQAPHRRPPAVRSYAAALCSTYEAWAAATGARVVVDGSKLPADAYMASLCDGLEVYFLEIVRDPRGVLGSQLRRLDAERRRGFNPRHDLYGAAAWTSRHLACRWLRRRLGSHRFLTVSYERLVAEPLACLAEISVLVGESVALPDVADDGTVHLGTAHTPIGNGRFGPTAVRLERDDRWVTDVSRKDILLTTILTGWLAGRFGYPLRPVAVRSHPPRVPASPETSPSEAG